MSNYAKTTDFAIKDTLVSGNPAKVIKGSEHDVEFNNIATAIASKADVASPNFTGTATFASISATGTISAVTFSGALNGNAATATSATTAISATSAGTAAQASALQTAGWHIFESGGYLYFQYGGVSKARLDTTGTFYCANELGGFIVGL